MKTYQKGFISPLLLALIALLILGGGTYVYVQKNQANQPAVVDSTVQATSTTQASDSQTADWKTYINSAPESCVRIHTTESGFVYIHNTGPIERYSIEYPASAQITEESGLDVPCAVDLSHATLLNLKNMTVIYGVDIVGTSSAALNSAKAIVATLKLQ